MIIPDANLLIYAYDELSSEHGKARLWWQAALAGRETIGIPWVLVLAFTRLMTHPHLCRHPLSVEQAREVVETWVRHPHVRMIQLSERALPIYFDLLTAAGLGGNLTTDALIALHAREHSAVVYSNDRDFDRFPGIKRINPLR